MSRRLDFSYRMELDFSMPAQNHQFTLRIVPHSDERQRITACEFSLEPECELHRDIDAFGNTYIYGEAKQQHERFAVTVKGSAEIDAQKHVSGKSGSEMRFSHYRFQSQYTKPDGRLLEYYNENKKRAGENAAAYARRLLHAIYTDMEYRQGVTDIYTTAEEALAKRQGVCQDYAHIMLSLCRIADIPSRYVVGMMMGEGYSHAWVEIFSDGFWYGMDPTNDKEADDAYIKISHGRDYKDCIVNRGVFIGGGEQTQHIQVIVEQSAEMRGK